MAELRRKIRENFVNRLSTPMHLEAGIQEHALGQEYEQLSKQQADAVPWKI